MEEKIKSGVGVSTGGPATLLHEMKILKEMHDQSGARKPINSELWHACAGPLVSLPQVGSLVYYFPQGHSEQVAASTKCFATSEIPNYPNLPSQLLCQVHSVSLHADKDTDETFAQMSLQPVKSEKDVLPVPCFGLRPSKHPTDFFCKTLTASDTSTHGGFSVPRRAAEKLFPPLDFVMQPPTQELVVKDLHGNAWTFRHIYRGQPKRHLLTTGWSIFVGSKRLRAGDSVLFIRDEKSQLLVGVRRANRVQASFPSSVLSADTMHIGVLAAAAHAAVNRIAFTVFYNPRACRSEFVVPIGKYRKVLYGSQISAGMRFGMMFETEESGKRRYMGTIVGVTDLDPLRWPGSKWRNLQVDWDEPGCGDKPTRVSAWEVETPERLFVFPSLAASGGYKRTVDPRLFGELDWRNSLKRPCITVPDNRSSNLPILKPCPSIPNLCLDELAKMLMRPQSLNYNPVSNHVVPCLSVEEPKAEVQIPILQKPQVLSTDMNPFSSGSQHCLEQPDLKDERDSNENQKLLPAAGSEKCNSGSVMEHNSTSILADNSDRKLLPPQLEQVPQADFANFNGLLPCTGPPYWHHCSLADVPQLTNPSAMMAKQDAWSASLDETTTPVMSQLNHGLWDHRLENNKHSSQGDGLGSFDNSLRDLSTEETNNQSGIYGYHEMDRESGSAVVEPPLSNSILDEFCGLKDSGFQYPSDCLVGNFSSCQDIQSQITSESLVDSQPFPLQDFPDNSGGTCSSNVDFDQSSLLQNSTWQQVMPPMRTYTKVQRAGSVGRSIDVTSFKNYDELCSAIERMFGLEGLLTDPRVSGWKLVYVDFENDVLLVGDDPWDEFVGCARCIRILSPAEVQQMSEEGMQLLNGNPFVAC